VTLGASVGIAAFISDGNSVELLTRNAAAMMGAIEPLASALWFRRIEKIANGEMEGIENALRKRGLKAALRDVGVRC
jgi:hypothetical protein